MGKVIYLLILLLLWFGGWELKMIPISLDVQLIIVFAYLIFGAWYFGSKKNGVQFHRPNRYFIWIMLGIFISMIPAYIYWGQSFLQSLITYRFQYYMFAIPLLFIIKPTQEELIRTLEIFSFVLFGVFLLKTSMPHLFELRESFVLKHENGDTDILISGYPLLAIPFYYTLQQVRERFEIKKMLYLCFILVFVFLMSNRSTLFPMVMLSCITFLQLKSRYRFFIIILMLLVGSYAVYLSADVWKELFEETQLQLNDPDYNRNKALAYFLYAASPNWVCSVLGNGYLSAHVNQTMLLMMDEGIYNSDIGFIGYWNHFGLIPTCVMIYMYIHVLVKRRFPFFLKLIAIQTLLGGLTISYFARTTHMIFFILFYYLYMYNDTRHSYIRE